MTNDEIKKANRKALPKFLLVTVVCSIIGGNALYGGHGGMVQVFIGTVTFGLISNILQLFGLSTAVQYIVQGAILLLAINLDNLKKR